MRNKINKIAYKILSFGLMLGLLLSGIINGDKIVQSHIVYAAHYHNFNCYPSNTTWHSCDWYRCIEHGAEEYTYDYWVDGSDETCSSCGGSGSTGSEPCSHPGSSCWADMNPDGCSCGAEYIATGGCIDCGWDWWECDECGAGGDNGVGGGGVSSCSSCGGSGTIHTDGYWDWDWALDCPYSGCVVYTYDNWATAPLICDKVITSAISLSSTCVHTGDSTAKAISTNSGIYSHVVPSTAQSMKFIVNYTTLDGNNRSATLTYNYQTRTWGSNGLSFSVSNYSHDNYSPSGQAVTVGYTNPSSNSSYSGRTWSANHYITVDGFMPVGFKGYNALMGKPVVLAAQIDSVNFKNQYLIGQNIYADAGAYVGYHLTHWTYKAQTEANKNLTNYNTYFTSDVHLSYGQHYDGAGWSNVTQDGIVIPDVVNGGLDYLIKDYRPLGIYFTPHYAPDTYTIDFVPDDTGVPLKTMKVSYGTTANDVPIPVRKGEIFLGWFLNDQLVTNGTIFSEALLGTNKDVVKDGARFTVAARWLNLRDALLIKYDSFYKKEGIYQDRIDGLPEVSDIYGFDWKEWYFKEYLNNGSDSDRNTSHNNPIY